MNFNMRKVRRSARWSIRRRFAGLAAALAAIAMVLGLGTGPAAASTYVTWQNSGNGLCIDVPHSTTMAGAPLQVYGCNGTYAQSWYVRASSYINGGWAYQYANRGNGQCITMSSNLTNAIDGTALLQEPCNSNGLRTWWYLPYTTMNGNYVWYFKNAGYPYECMDDPWDSSSWGTQLQVWSCHYSTNQLWY